MIWRLKKARLYDGGHNLYLYDDEVARELGSKMCHHSFTDRQSKFFEEKNTQGKLVEFLSWAGKETHEAKLDFVVQWPVITKNDTSRLKKTWYLLLKEWKVIFFNYIWEKGQPRIGSIILAENSKSWAVWRK